MKKLVNMLLLHVQIALPKFVAFIDVTVFRNTLIPVSTYLVLIVIKVIFRICLFLSLTLFNLALVAHVYFECS